MCFLPPMCVFCRHYNQDAGVNGPDCSAFVEIPDQIFHGDFDHREPFPGDGGLRFELDPEQADDFEEVMEMKAKLAEGA